ncbi:HAMP domain-containing sensor histidine kinase [Planococcus sp. ISL-109]|uniref:sensor histidine kinase n=1 Tax=Planococcus sp. ISL-109 TaxID=2819166 RepID=UPI001BE775D9|nr:HAMP domain-containing sensor histidine kinase [Planococcus sp. ISL-109]MBT2583893.1 GHKL domain-containing protein [Planococcus sp. ISL-109]
MKGINARLWWLFAGISIAGIALLAFVTVSVFDAVYVDSEREQLTDMASALADAYSKDDPEALSTVHDYLDNTGIQAVTVDDPMVLGSALPLQAPEEDVIITFEERERLASGEMVIIERANAYLGDDLIGAAVPVVTGGELTAVALVYRPVSDLSQAFLNVLPVLIAAGVLALIALLLIRRRIQQEYTGPLEVLGAAADGMASGRFSGATGVTADNEVGELARSFEKMAASIQAEDDNKREFLQNVSHELRTPLSYIKGYSELLQTPAKDQMKIAGILYEESERMERLVNQLLDLSRLEGGEGQLNKELLAFAEVVREAVEKTAVKWRGKSLTVRAELDEELLVEGDSDRLLQVLINLLDNAIAHTEPLGEIAIRLRADNSRALLEVADSGHGIAKEHVPYLTERFYRAEQGRVRTGGGAGIGLSIVQEIVKLHGGTLEIESEIDRGTKVRIFLPLKDI